MSRLPRKGQSKKLGRGEIIKDLFHFLCNTQVVLVVIMKRVPGYELVPGGVMFSLRRTEFAGEIWY